MSLPQGKPKLPKVAYGLCRYWAAPCAVDRATAVWRANIFSWILADKQRHNMRSAYDCGNRTQIRDYLGSSLRARWFGNFFELCTPFVQGQRQRAPEAAISSHHYVFRD